MVPFLSLRRLDSDLPRLCLDLLSGLVCRGGRSSAVLPDAGAMREGSGSTYDEDSCAWLRLSVLVSAVPPLCGGARPDFTAVGGFCRRCAAFALSIAWPILRWNVLFASS